jgi:hypothetical protein
MQSICKVYFCHNAEEEICKEDKLCFASLLISRFFHVYCVVLLWRFCGRTLYAALPFAVKDRA